MSVIKNIAQSLHALTLPDPSHNQPKQSPLSRQGNKGIFSTVVVFFFLSFLQCKRVTRI